MTDLKFDANGLIPAIIQDHYTKKVLMLAYMNAESLDITIKEGKTCFYSRSRQELWRKGATSGNFQNVVSIRTDCDKDTLLIDVIKEGLKENYDIAKKSVKKAMELEVELTIKGSDDEEDTEMDITVAQIGSKWYMVTSVGTLIIPGLTDF